LLSALSNTFAAFGRFGSRDFDRRGFNDPTYGARPMRRAVEKYLEDPLAEEFLRANIKQGDTLEVHAAGEQLAFKVTQPEQSEPANASPLRSRG
jgi:hypothetical protein